MKSWIAIAMLTMLSMSQAEAQTAKFKGYIQVATEVGTRIGDGGQAMPINRYIPSSQLFTLMGSWSGDFGDEHVFQNGDPNSVNMLLYYLVMNGFANEMANHCDPTATPDSMKFVMTPEFTRTVETICKWPAADAQDETVMSDFFLGIMGYDAPEEEFEAWRTFFTTSMYESKGPKETMRAMVLTLSMNPYFLLQH